MLDTLARKYHGHRLARRAYNAIETQIGCYFSHGALSRLSNAQKQELRHSVHAVVRDVLADTNPTMALRHQLVGAVYYFAKFQVLVIDKETQRVGFLDTPYISGELKPRIAELLPTIKDPDLTGIPEDANPFDVCGFQQSLWLMWTNSLNAVRELLDDCDPAQDWLRPFVLSALVAAEDHYRQQLKMPSLLPHEYAGMIYGGFSKHVLDGARNPLVTWQQAVDEVSAFEGGDSLRLLAEIGIRFVTAPAE
jgi:hypothetical protein